MGLSMSGYDSFCDQIPDIEKYFDKFQKVLGEDRRYFIRGDLRIVDGTGKYWESFEVEIHCSVGFPFRFPAVFEVGNKIPRIADWHIYEDSHKCCIAVLPEEIIKCRNGISLIQFVEKEMLPYFFNQTHRRIEGYYVLGEYSHGVEGIFEFFDCELRCGKNPRKIISMIFQIADTERPAGSNNCFCGSGAKFRKCHRTAYDKLILLGQSQLRDFANLLAKVSGNLDLVL